MNKIGVLLVFTLYFSYIFCSHIHPYWLKVEHLSDPRGVDNSNPRLSWAIKSVPYSNGTIPKNYFQTAYRIYVASSMALLKTETTDLWDSGKVKSSDTLNIRYEGKKLNPGQGAVWTVRIWDQNDVVSDYGMVSIFFIAFWRTSKFN